MHFILLTASLFSGCLFLSKLQLFAVCSKNLQLFAVCSLLMQTAIILTGNLMHKLRQFLFCQCFLCLLMGNLNGSDNCFIKTSPITHISLFRQVYQVCSKVTYKKIYSLDIRVIVSSLHVSVLVF